MNQSVPDRVSAVRGRYDLRRFIAQELGIDTRIDRRYIQVRCPFHSDSNPSMAVYEANYYCHGCREHGDIVDWVRHRDGSDFFAALEMLEGPQAFSNPARIPARPLPPQPEVPSKVSPERLRGALRALVKAGQIGMPQSPAQAYCLSRGWGYDTQQDYCLGYVNLRSEDLESMGGRDCFEEMGLLYRSGHPWFSDRLLIPILDPFGSPVAIATRVLHPTDGPRYINSRRSALFRRDETVYGSHLAGGQVGVIWVVEGYADVWSLNRIGEKAVAVMGDRLTDFHVRWLALAAQNQGARIMLAFDGDEAGQEGERLAWTRLCQEDVLVSRLALRGGQDVSGSIEQDDGRSIRQAVQHLRRTA